MKAVLRTFAIVAGLLLLAAAPILSVQAEDSIEARITVLSQGYMAADAELSALLAETDRIEKLEYGGVVLRNDIARNLEKARRLAARLETLGRELEALLALQPPTKQPEAVAETGKEPAPTKTDQTARPKTSAGQLAAQETGSANPDQRVLPPEPETEAQDQTATGLSLDTLTLDVPQADGPASDEPTGDRAPAEQAEQRAAADEQPQEPAGGAEPATKAAPPSPQQAEVPLIPYFRVVIWCQGRTTGIELEGLSEPHGDYQRPVGINSATLYSNWKDTPSFNHAMKTRDECAAAGKLTYNIYPGAARIENSKVKIVRVASKPEKYAGNRPPRAAAVTAAYARKKELVQVWERMTAEWQRLKPIVEPKKAWRDAAEAELKQMSARIEKLKKSSKPADTELHNRLVVEYNRKLDETKSRIEADLAGDVGRYLKLLPLLVQSGQAFKQDDIATVEALFSKSPLAKEFGYVPPK